jgi:probable rRNA maturation factor
VISALEKDAILTLRFVGRVEGSALNRQYRGSDHPTNVLSFVYDNDGNAVCGDLVLCLPVLRREAREQGKTMEAHCAHLVMHGVLHVQGYDHETASDAYIMEARERAALSRLGFADPYGSEDR